MSQIIEQAVKSKYGAVATSGLSTDHSGVRAVAEAFGYCCFSAQPFNDGLHRRLLDLLTRYNVNDYAASVRVFAVKPQT